MMAQAQLNDTLLDYCYPEPAIAHGDVRRSWHVFHGSGCEVRNDCYCHHVQGDPSRSRNPDGYKVCAKLSTITQCSEHGKSCSCVSGSPCLFSDMRPNKIFSAILAARCAGVTHIIEEGRFGGLSALMYALHGFHVTSVEFLPLDGPTAALQTMASDVVLVTGDGRKLVPELVANLSAHEAARTMVIFDGEKRFGAYPTWLKVKPRVALGIFDDTNIEPKFNAHLSKQQEIWWDTTEPSFKRVFGPRESHVLPNLTRALGHHRRFYGGFDKLASFHFTIVKGDAWHA